MAAISPISTTRIFVQTTEAASSSSSPKPVIFLDIDGVLYLGGIGGGTALFPTIKQLFPTVEIDDYTADHYSTAATHFFYTDAVNHLETLIKKIPNVEIVLSSNWREKRTIEKLREIFKKHHFSQFIIDKTPDKLSKEDNEHYKSRGIRGRAQEIAYWLERHPEVTKFVILDDYDNGLSEAFSRNFVHIDRDALSEENIIQAASILGHPFDNKERSIVNDTITHIITRQPTPALTESTTSIVNIRPMIGDGRIPQNTLTSTSVDAKRSVAEDAESSQKPSVSSSCCIIL